MTKITFYKENGKFTGYSFEGHACFNTKGPDIVCAALSMASQMTANSLEELTDACVATESYDGLFALEITHECDDEKVQLLIESLYLAVMNLYEQYPDYMTLSRVGWSE